MVLDKIKDLASNLASTTLNGSNGANGASNPSKPSPFDPLNAAEISKSVALIVEKHGDAFSFNCVTVNEPPKQEMLAWLADPENAKKPARCAEIVAIGKGSKVYDGLVDLDEGVVKQFDYTPDVQPLITMEDLQVVEGIARKDPKVIEQCGILGIPESDMHKVYCDPWTIGYDERFGNSIRLQQAFMYYRPNVDDCQYAYPLDFCPIYNADTQEIIDIDVPEVRRPLSKAPPINYHAKAIEANTNPSASEALKAAKGDANGTAADDRPEPGWREVAKPLKITQPEGVSFTLEGRNLKWQNWSLHVGFNYREGIVLNNIGFHDRVEGKLRPVFYRVSLSEMVVPYGNPEHPHHRKHAFDLGEYGGGYMTNSLSLGCDCKGAIKYLDADFVNKAGKAYTIPNAICIHEEDGGILFKHSDFRDDTATVTRARKLIISQVFTAANYEYAVYWILHQNGEIQLEIKLTGILNTYACSPDEDLKGWGTQVYPGVNAHNHEHLFCLRLDPNIDGGPNTIFQVDATRSEAALGSKENPYGNAFYAKKTPYKTPATAMAQYDANTSRTWDIANPNKLNPFSGKPVAYKLVSREVPRLMPKEGSLVWKRAAFARNAIHVTKYKDGQLYPAGRHVPQTSGEELQGLPQWIEADPDANIENEDVVLWHTFGLLHFPSPEDFPVMPCEPFGLVLRPRNFFDRNPAMDVKPSHSSWPSTLTNPQESWSGGAGAGESWAVNGTH